MRYRTICVVLVAAVLGSTVAHAETETDRLREALRSATGQLRALEDQRTAMQAKLAEADREKANLKLQVDSQKARAAQAEKDYRQAVEDFNARLDERNQALEKWKGAYEEAANRRHDGGERTGSRPPSRRNPKSVAGL
jgi:peptidoglycan hydrolase CwlO-like protein